VKLKKINDVAAHDPVDEVPCRARNYKKQRGAYKRSEIFPVLSIPDTDSADYNSGRYGKNEIASAEHTERDASIGNVGKLKKTSERYDLSQIHEASDQKLCYLVKD
jgi:hypothetical protein